MSWELQVGEMQTAYLTETEVWQSFHQFFYDGKKKTTYKFGFLKALIEASLQANAKQEIPYDAIFYSFTQMYWNLVHQYELWQSNTQNQLSSVQKIIVDFANKYAIPKHWNFEKLPDVQKTELIKSIKNIGKRYVIGATYGDFSGNIYTFDLKREYLQLHPLFLKIMQQHRHMLIDLTNYHLAKFLEKYNSTLSVQGLLQKVETITYRQSLKKFQLLLQRANIQRCFYCDKLLDKVHVDHFIPWSYFQHDLLWNFVLSCPKCNSSKNNRLPATLYLEKLYLQNEQLAANDSVRENFQGYTREKLETLFHFAHQNGIKNNWHPKKMSGT